MPLPYDTNVHSADIDYGEAPIPLYFTVKYVTEDGDDHDTTIIAVHAYSDKARTMLVMEDLGPTDFPQTTWLQIEDELARHLKRRYSFREYVFDICRGMHGAAR